jgi:1,4-alpha-glucan branching enzyme
MTVMKKRYLKSKPVCKVTFELPVKSAKKVCVVGEFNQWDTASTPMKKRKNGTYAVTLELEKDREYQFRYLIDGEKWANDSNADGYVTTPYGDGENSVVMV